jgi:hypothetical protein
MSGHERDDHRDAEWGERLSPLGEANPPGTGFQDRTVRSLKETGFLRPERPGRLIRVLLPLAAAVVLFLMGSWWGRNSTEGSAGDSPRFAMFLLEDSTFSGMSSVGHDSLVAEYSAWAGQLAASGNLVLGEELGNSSMTLGPSDGRQTAQITGFFVLSAANPEAALALARTCPHLRYGGSIVLRPIQASS